MSEYTFKFGEEVAADEILFSGIYENYEDINIQGSMPFDTSFWLETIDAEMRRLKELDPMRSGSRTMKFAPPHLLPIIPLIDDILHKKRLVNILDIGGGMGDNYCYLMYWYPEEARKLLNYTIMETKNNCIKGSSLGLLGNVQWFENRNEKAMPCNFENFSMKDIDIIILCGTLQYLHPWGKVIEEITKLGAKYIYISRTPLQEVRNTFYSLQHIVPAIGKYQNRYLGDVAMSVINKNELTNCIESSGKYKRALDLFLARCGTERYEYGHEIEVAYYNMIYTNK